MNARTLSQIAIFGFLICGVLGVTARRQARLDRQHGLETSKWRISYDIRFRAEGEETQLRYAIPFESHQIKLKNEEWGEPFGIDSRTRVLKWGRTRERVLTINNQGEYRLSPVFELEIRPTWSPELAQPEGLKPDARSFYLREEPTLSTRLEGVQSVLQQAENECTDEEQSIRWFFEYCSKTLNDAEPGADHGVLSSLTNGAATPLGRVRVMVTLCRAYGLPARRVIGFELRSTNTLTPHAWLEVYHNRSWHPFDPVNGYAWRLPDSFVAVRRGGEQIVKLSSPGLDRSGDVQDSYQIERIAPNASTLRDEWPGPADILDLTRLPYEMQKVLALLLLLPFGALITAFFRNVIGVMTFGTFAPALFALSFIDSDWGTGLVILLVVVIAGLTSRVGLERLRLLMVPRLSILLTTVILCVVIGVSALDYLRVTPSADAVLLPLVILTILIERFVVTTEEDSLAHSLKLVAGTLFVAACCFFVLRWEAVGRSIVVYPEMHFLTIAALIGIGRYTGYRLVELWRFRDLVTKDA